MRLAITTFIGAMVHATRIPERCYPGRFDLVDQSHNWMHIQVASGALVILGELWALFDSGKRRTWLPFVPALRLYDEV